MLSAKTPDKTASKVEPSSDVGAISGQVSAILGSGDLKPARFAQVYLFYINTPERFTGKEPISSLKTAGIVYWGQMGEFVLNEAKRTVENRNYTGQSSCQELAEYNLSRLKALDWARQNDSRQVIETQADEEGQFTFGNVPPGVWGLIVNGRVGMNDAFWEQTVTLEAGKRTSIKLVSPKASCLALK